MIKRIHKSILRRAKNINTIFLKLNWVFKKWLSFEHKEIVREVSVIIVGRNDNYGGDFSKRLQVTFDWNLKHFPNSEIIYIEWNQIKNRKSDCEWISKRYSNARCYIVSEEIHKCNSSIPDKMPVMEYFAKNIGIRKSKNDWLLMINADVFLGNDFIGNMHKLNNNTVYASHYIGIKWNGEEINDKIIKNKKIRVVNFAAPFSLGSVVGNLILTHKKNWLLATGYDERLTNVRAGVDTNGLNQLLNLGLRKQVIGHHYHLDHTESIIHGSNVTHGNHAFNNIPYKNPDNWGFLDYKEIEIGERIWRLEKI